MSQKPVKYDENMGLLRSMMNQLRLVGRLMNDRRVSGWLKLLPLGSVAYMISPFDPWIPFPVVGQVDDLAVMFFGLKFFIDMCPPEVVDEHMRAISGTPPADFEVVDTASGNEDTVPATVVEGDFEEIDE